MELYEATTQQEEIEVMQRYIDNGMAWKLEGSVGREAMRLIESGHCILGETGHSNAYGNRVPSRFEVKQGTKGSVEYQEKMREENPEWFEFE